MNSKHWMLTLSIATCLIPGCVPGDTGDEAQQETALAHPDKTNSPGLKKLTELDLQHLGGLQAHSTIQPRSPAQGVTYFQFFAVASTNSGDNWEFVDSSQSATRIDHGGAELSVALLQYGQGIEHVTLNASSGTHWATDLLCGSPSTLHFCSIGEEITGYIFYYSFNGQQGGDCSAFTVSTASPSGVSRDSITIL
jgi:hypothetical protein